MPLKHYEGHEGLNSPTEFMMTRSQATPKLSSCKGGK